MQSNEQIEGVVSYPKFQMLRVTQLTELSRANRNPDAFAQNSSRLLAADARMILANEVHGITKRIKLHDTVLLAFIWKLL